MAGTRTSFVRFTEQEDFPVWRECLQGAFEYFGGVPHEVLQAGDYRA